MFVNVVGRNEGLKRIFYSLLSCKRGMEKERLTLFAVTLITKRLMPISTGCAWTTKVSFKANQCQEPLVGKEVGIPSVII
jgi:hypothetical protein